MKPAENIDKLIKKLKFSASPQLDERVHADISRQLQESKKTQPALTGPNIWRIIMNNRIAKLAAVAAIIIAAGLLVIFFEKSITPAYAIEQTVEAFEKVDSVYVEEMSREESGVHFYRIWARRSSDGKFLFGDFRQESSEGDIIVASKSENLTYCYYPSTKTVHIYKGSTVTIGDFLDSNFFLRLIVCNDKVRYLAS